MFKEKPSSDYSIRETIIHKATVDKKYWIYLISWLGWQSTTSPSKPCNSFTTYSSVILVVHLSEGQ